MGVTLINGLIGLTGKQAATEPVAQRTSVVEVSQQIAQSAQANDAVITSVRSPRDTYAPRLREVDKAVSLAEKLARQITDEGEGLSAHATVDGYSLRVEHSSRA